MWLCPLILWHSHPEMGCPPGDVFPNCWQFSFSLSPSLPAWAIGWPWVLKVASGTMSDKSFTTIKTNSWHFWKQHWFHEFRFQRNNEYCKMLTTEWNVLGPHNREGSSVVIQRFYTCIIDLVLSYHPLQPPTLVADGGGGGWAEVSPDVTGVAVTENHSCCGDIPHLAAWDSFHEMINSVHVHHFGRLFMKSPHKLQQYKVLTWCLSYTDSQTLDRDSSTVLRISWKYFSSVQE